MKNIVITGTNSGFGNLMVRTLAKDGHNVFATMREVNGKNAEAAKQLSDWAEAEGHKIHVVELDVTSDSSVETAINSILDTAGNIDIVVNNAGVVAGGLMETFTTEDYHRVFNVNVLGPHRVYRAVLPDMRKNKAGLFINISSVVGRLVFPFIGPYVPSKYALEAMTISYNLELAPLGIQSVLIEPGAYGTEIFNKIVQPSDPARAESYGELASAPQKMFESMGEMLQGDQAPDPQLIADAVKKLVDMPDGQRPLRTVVDKMTGPIVEELNQAAEKAQNTILQAMG